MKSETKKYINILTDNTFNDFTSYDIIGNNNEQIIKRLQDMKFKAIVGNPPYQVTKEGTSDNPVYHLFMDVAYKMCDKVSLITPARFLFNAGKTPKSWNEQILKDKHFKVVWYKQKSSNVFPNVDIKGGVAVTFRDAKQNFGGIGTFTDFEELNTILSKVISRDDFSSLIPLVYAPESYKIAEQLHVENPTAVTKLSKGHQYDITTNIFDKLPELFYDSKPIDGKEYIQLLGRTNNDRILKWIKRDYIKPHPNLNKYKVILPKSNGSGAIGEELSTPLIGDPLIGHTQTFISIGKFDTAFEAAALLRYIKSKFARTMLGVLKITQDNKKSTWANVPLQDFTKNSDIDWSVSVAEIDTQLYAKYSLTDDEIAFIESTIKPME